MDLNHFLLVFHIQWCMKYPLEEINPKPDPGPDPKTMITPYLQSRNTDRHIQVFHPHVSKTRNLLSGLADQHIQTLSRYPNIAITQNPQSRTTHQHIQTFSRYPHIVITQPLLHTLILSTTRFSSRVS